MWVLQEVDVGLEGDWEDVPSTMPGTAAAAAADGGQSASLGAMLDGDLDDEEWEEV